MFRNVTVILVGIDKLLYNVASSVLHHVSVTLKGSPIYVEFKKNVEEIYPWIFTMVIHCSVLI